jgi:hypothetical protein
VCVCVCEFTVNVCKAPTDPWKEGTGLKPRIIRNTGTTIVGHTLKYSYHITSVCLYKRHLIGGLGHIRTSMCCPSVKI